MHLHLVTLVFAAQLAAEPAQLSGIYPHLAMFNDEGECGTGALVPWAGRLWVVTYAPHFPKGDRSNKLYEITPDLRQIIRPESIGGTPANRMIHDESRQLFIGPYAIGAGREVRAIPYDRMFGRPTGNARHLATPAEKILYATMEEGIYEVDVRTLDVTELWRDEQLKGGRKADLPGYHGKGFYSGQGVYVYANNGEHGNAARKRPDVPSGVLAEWDGRTEGWHIVRRNQFTEVTGPGGIRGNPTPADDPIWALGWDAKSLLLGVRMRSVNLRSATPAGLQGAQGSGLDTGAASRKDAGSKPALPSPWTFYRLPKGSHSYDGAHGWNTEWPRIREIGAEDFLMTMHGTFWRFPKTFTAQNSAGIAPRSNYLKVIGDFCEWNGRIVLGCDDTARNEFLNKRKAKGKIAAPQSQSNLWFLAPERLDALGPAIGRGAVWLAEAVKAGVPSDPFLFSGYAHRGLHLVHDAQGPATFRLEVDREGNGRWTTLREVTVGPSGALPPGRAASGFVAFTPEEAGTWIRVVSDRDLATASAVFTCRNQDERTDKATPIFAGLARPGESLTGGIVRARNKNKRTLSFAAVGMDGSELGYYELDAGLKLRRTDDAPAHQFTKANAAMARGVLRIEDSSVLYTDESGRRWRLPKGDAALDEHPLGGYRVAREVATERDFFNAHGTIYELPARNAGGFSKLRPVASHNRLIHDFCSYRGLFVISGITSDPKDSNPHIIRSDDRRTALWAGAIDDVWQLGKPRGTGGPWKNTRVRAGQASDPYLMTVYDRKTLTITTDQATTITAEIDISGEGHWTAFARSFETKAGTSMTYVFPEAFSAYWIRFTSSTDCTATAMLCYE